MRVLSPLVAASVSCGLKSAIAVDSTATLVSDYIAVNYTDPQNGWSFLSPGCLISDGTNLSTPGNNIVSRTPTTFEDFVNIGIAKVTGKYSEKPPQLFSVTAIPKLELQDPNRDYFKIIIYFGWSDSYLKIVTKPMNLEEWEDPEPLRPGLLPPPDQLRPFEFSQTNLTIAQALQLVSDGGFKGPFRDIQIQRPRVGQAAPADQIFFSFSRSRPGTYNIAVSSQIRKPFPFRGTSPIDPFEENTALVNDPINDTSLLAARDGSGFTIQPTAVVKSPSTPLAALPTGFELIVNEGIVKVNSKFYSPFPKLYRVEANPKRIFRDPDNDWTRITLRFSRYDKTVQIVWLPSKGGWQTPTYKSPEKSMKDFAPFDYHDVRISVSRAVYLVGGGNLRHFESMHIMRPKAPYQPGADQRFYAFWMVPRDMGVGDIVQVPFYFPPRLGMENDTDSISGPVAPLSGDQDSNATVQALNSNLMTRNLPQTFEENLLIGINIVQSFFTDPQPQLFLITATPKPVFTYTNTDWHRIILSFDRGHEIIEIQTGSLWGVWQAPTVLPIPKSRTLTTINLVNVPLTVVEVIHLFFIAVSSPIVFDIMIITRPSPESQKGGSQRFFQFVYFTPHPGRAMGTYVFEDETRHIRFYPTLLSPSASIAVSGRCDLQ